MNTVGKDSNPLPRLTKALRQLRRRRLPYGLFSLRFLALSADPYISSHRSLRLSTSCAWRAFFTAANFWLLPRWLIWSAWRMSENVVRSHGDAAQNAGAPPPAGQRRAVLRLALLHSIPPQAWYLYQLWQPSRNKWAYVYDNELPQFHQFHNGKVKGAGSRLLADKWLFAHTATARGIAMPPSLAELHSGGHEVLLALLGQHQALFCKPRFGNASHGAFAVIMRDSVLQLKLLADGTVQQGMSATDTITRLLSQCDYLVQPLLANHATLQALCDQEVQGFAEAISLRLLSRHRQGKFDLFGAYLEIPRRENGHKIHALIAIDADTGRLRTDDDNWHYHQLRQRHPQLLPAAADITIPHWHQILAQALKAHACANDINIVAWDFIVTDEGALLLEGNINWRVTPVQILFGPLLPRLHMQ